MVCVDASSGALTWQGVLKDDQGGVDGLYSAGELVVSNDGYFIYVTAYDDDAVSWYQRDPVSGALTWLGMVKDAIGGVDGIDGARDILLSPDDQFLYVTGQVDSAIACFERNQTSGSLSYLSTYRDGANGMDGLGAVTSIASTPDGSTIYVTSQHDHSLAWFERNATTGQLTFRNIFRNGEQGSQHLNSTAGAEVSEDGKHLYCIGLKPDGNFTINLFALDPFTGDPTYRGSNSVIKNGENLLDGLWGFSLSGDG